MGTTSRPGATQIGIDDVLATTRSVRTGLDFSRPVARELIEECIELALQAPTGVNLQNAHFVVVTDPDRRRALGDIYRRGWEAFLQTPVAAGALDFTDPERLEGQRAMIGSAMWLAEHIHEAPALVIPCVDFGIGSGRPFAAAGYARDTALPVLMHAGAWGAVLPAATHFRLAARARGLGSCWTVVHLIFEREAAELLGIPYEGVMQAAMFPVAHADAREFHRASRPALPEALHWDGW